MNIKTKFLGKIWNLKREAKSILASIILCL